MNLFFLEEEVREGLFNGKNRFFIKKLRKEEIRKVFEQRHSLTWKASTKFPKIPNGNLNIL